MCYGAHVPRNLLFWCSPAAVSKQVLHPWRRRLFRKDVHTFFGKLPSAAITPRLPKLRIEWMDALQFQLVRPQGAAATHVNWTNKKNAMRENLKSDKDQRSSRIFSRLDALWFTLCGGLVNASRKESCSYASINWSSSRKTWAKLPVGTFVPWNLSVKQALYHETSPWFQDGSPDKSNLQVFPFCDIADLQRKTGFQHYKIVGRSGNFNPMIMKKENRYADMPLSHTKNAQRAKPSWPSSFNSAPL